MICVVCFQKAAADRLQNSEAADQVQQEPGAAGGAAELQEPTRPVGKKIHFLLFITIKCC